MVYVTLQQVPLTATYIRDHIAPPNPDRIAGFLDNIHAGVGIPVITTRTDPDRPGLRVLDGRHRWLAYHLAGYNHIITVTEHPHPVPGALPLYNPETLMTRQALDAASTWTAAR